MFKSIRQTFFVAALIGGALVTIIAFQNFTFSYPYSFSYSTITITPTPTPVPTPASVDVSLLNGDYALVESKSVIYTGTDGATAPPANGGTTSSTDRSLTTTFASYLQYTSADLKVGDVFVVMADVEMSHQSPSTEKTTATVSAYLTCNGSRASAIMSKSLKRYYGNHHGAMVVSTACTAKSAQTPFVINLMAKSDLANGLIHGAQQTQLIVNHYRLLSAVADRTLAYAPKDAASDKSPSMTITRTAVNATEKSDFQNLPIAVGRGDLVYVSGQATASQPTGAIPMFGYELYVGTSRVSYATENLVAGGVPRLGQNLVAMWTAKSDLNFLNSKVIALRSDGASTGLSLEGSFSRLLAIVFEKGLSARSLMLKKLVSKVSTQAVSLAPSEANLHSPVQVEFKRAGILHIQSSAAFTSSAYGSSSCQIRLAVTGPSGVLRSIPSLRTFQPPYLKGSLSTEFVYEVPAAGVYTIQTLGACSGANATVAGGSSGLLIQGYEAD